VTPANVNWTELFYLEVGDLETKDTGRWRFETH
jgi:hypothetical protein